MRCVYMHLQDFSNFMDFELTVCLKSRDPSKGEEKTQGGVGWGNPQDRCQTHSFDR